jgi:hypothetical protein
VSIILNAIRSIGKARDQTLTTHLQGKGTKTIGIIMQKKMSDELERRAKSMKLSTGAYCKIILKQQIASGKKLELN